MVACSHLTLHAFVKRSKCSCFLGFKEYLIARCQKDGCNFKYVVEDDEDNNAPPRTVLLEGPADEKRDPLRGYRRIELMVTPVNNKLYITGIKNGGECVMKVANEQT